MTLKPTREVVAESYKRVTDTLCTVYAQANLDVLWQAYLAQEEELKEKNAALKRHMESIVGRGEAIKRLEADNQALKASMEAEYIERQAKRIQALVEENEALKVRLKGTFEPEEPQRPRVLRYTTDDATGDEGNDGGQP